MRSTMGMVTLLLLHAHALAAPAQDCSGEPGGAKVIDDCGVCGGANHCLDCNGDARGISVADKCGVCDDRPANDCTLGCDGEWGSGASSDLCGVCGGTNTCLDCAGVPRGKGRVDACGVCDSNPANDCAVDCFGRGAGPAVPDTCGVCDGDGTLCQDCAGVPHGKARRDRCGVCDSDPTNDCAADCTGLAGGLLTLDSCGVCGGDGTSCKKTYTLMSGPSVELPTGADLKQLQCNIAANLGEEWTKQNCPACTDGNGEGYCQVEVFDGDAKHAEHDHRRLQGLVIIIGNSQPNLLQPNLLQRAPSSLSAWSARLTAAATFAVLRNHGRPNRPTLCSNRQQRGWLAAPADHRRPIRRHFRCHELCVLRHGRNLPPLRWGVFFERGRRCLPRRH